MKQNFVHISNDIRALKLKSGDTFESDGRFIEYSNGQFFEVYYDGYDYRHMCERWARTGKRYILDELNGVLMEKYFIRESKDGYHLYERDNGEKEMLLAEIFDKDYAEQICKQFNR